MVKDHGGSVVETTRMRLMDQASIIIVVALWLLTAGVFRYLPADIPIHFNWKGEPDLDGKKVLIFLLPFLSTLLNLLLGYLAKHPELHNYPVKITKENSAYWFERSASLLYFVRLIVSAIFFVLAIIVIVAAFNGQSNQLFYLLAGLLLALPAGIVLMFIRPGSSKPS